MKKLYFGLLIFFNLITIGNIFSQTATTTVYYTGFQACGGCAVCGQDYWCTNTPGSYCGNTAPCITKTFFDPVPAGHVVTSVNIDYYTGSCEGAGFVSSINGFGLPLVYDGTDGCLCSDAPCIVAATLSEVFPCGLPNYVYGGTNTFYLCSYAPMCINRAVLTFTYVDPDVITPSITPSGPLDFCEGGSVSLDAGGGYSSYTWSTGSGAQSITVSSAGTYSVTVGSITGCTTGSSSVDVTIQPYTAPTFAQLGPYCQGESPGSLPTTSQNGVTGSWSPSSISTSSEGSSTYTFTPNSGQCSNATTMTVDVNPSAVTTFDQLGPYCVGESPDALPTTSTNGVNGTWSPSSISTSSSGSTSYTFTPSVVCATIASMSIVINENPVANAVIHGIPSCNGLSDGSIVLGVTGGLSPYTFAWSNGATSQNLLDIPTGIYNVLVTDINGCTASSSADVGEPDPVTGNVVSVTEAICTSYGSATVEGVGGTTPYTYTWPASAGGISGGTASQLNAGSYIVTIDDTYNCQGTVDVDVSQTGGITANIFNISPTSCYGGSDGEITVIVNGGNPDYSFDWGTDNGTSSSDSYSITNLSADTYTINITDGNGCDYIITDVTVDEPNEIIATPINIVDVDCFGSTTGSAEIDVNGGTSPYIITWPSGVTGPIANNLAFGSYPVTVSDANACTTTTLVTINQTDSLVVSEVLNDAACFGEYGNAVINVESGGNPPFDIIWDDGSTQFQHNAIPPETLFAYTITDNNGCSYTNGFTVSQPELLEVSIEGTDLTCYNNNSGQAMASVTGGTMPYFYEWNNGVVNPGIGNLNADTYSITVTDYNGCTATESITLNQPDLIALDLNTIDVVCGNILGQASVNSSGGIPPYQFNWSNGDTVSNIENLMAGNYNITVTDSNNCSATNSFVIGLTGNIETNILAVQEVLCPNGQTGVLTAESSNGVSPFSYLWSTNSTSQSINNLVSGDYSLTLTDSWGCLGSSQYELIPPEDFSVVEILNEVHCFGGNDGSISLIVSGGTSPYSFLWSNNNSGSTATGLGAGAYGVTITDANDCQTNYTYVLDAPDDDLRVAAIVQPIICHGQANGEITMTANGGTPPYQYSCYYDVYDFIGQHVTNLIAGSYIIQVTDDHGCTYQGTVTIPEPSLIEATFVTTNPSCIGNNDGYIELIVEGGIPPYNFETQGANFDLPYFHNLLQGEYYITVYDDNLCEIEVGPIILNDNDVLCLKIPNAITPNSDGVNDSWIIEGIEDYPSHVIHVFNRWGQELYCGKHGDAPWDGKTLGGDKVPTGNYLYVIELYEKIPPFVGNITVVY